MGARTVWIFNHYALPISEAGGSRHYVLARELMKRNHRVILIAACRNYQAPEQSRLNEHEDYRLEYHDRVPFLWLRTPAYSSNGMARLMNMLAYAMAVVRGTALKELPAPDLIVGSSPHPFAALAAYRVARRRKVPFVLEIRDIWPQSLIDIGGMSSGHPLILTLSAIERFLYRRARTVISLLPGAADHVRTVAGRPVDVVWVPNGVDLTMVPRPRGFSANDRFTLVYAGAHGPANGLDVILDAVALLEQQGYADRFLVRLIGEGSDKGRLELRAASMGLTAVHFESAVPKQEIYSRLAEADAFLMVLKDSPVFRWGVSPNKLFDYLAIGRPVIFGVSTPFNPVEAADAGITVPPGDAPALAEAIRTLAEQSADQRRAMGERGRSYAFENHSFARLAARLEGVFDRALR